MSKYERNMDYLNRRKIIYRRNPITDKPSHVYDWGFFYEKGTREYFALFTSKAKINTYRSLKWHLHVLWHLNHAMSQDEFRETAFYLADRENGFVTFTLSEQTLETFIHDVSIKDLDERPPNKLRKIIFKDSCPLNRIEKLKIVGRVVGKQKLSETEIYDAMLLLHDDGEKLTINKIAEALGVSPRTIHRNMSSELKKEKKLLNTEL